MKKQREFQNKIVVITGASAGIGRATAYLFAKHGANLALLSRNRNRLESLQSEIESLGCKAFYLALDVADSEAVDRAADTIERDFGPIDIWVNNAMVSVYSPVKLTSAEEFKRVTEVTYLGVIYGTLAVLRKMLPRNSGTIIQIGSALAYRGIPLQSAYCASKHAIKGFHDSLRAELLHDGSNVNITMVQLPAINTPQFDWARSRLPHKSQPVPPIYQPEVAARAIMRAALHPEKREYRIGYPVFKTIWGNVFFPGFIDKYLGKKGYALEQTKEPKAESQPDNLFETVEGNFSSHGRFDRVAKKRILSVHKSLLYLLLAALIGFLLFLKGGV